MEVTYQLEGEEYWRYSVYVTLKSPSHWIGLAPTYLWLPILGFLLIAYSGTALLSWWLGAAIFALLWFAYRIWLWRKTCFDIINRSSADARRTTVSINAAGYTTNRIYSRSWSSWKRVTGLERVGPDLLLRHGGAFETLVPRRAFGSEAEAAAFFTTIERFWREAQAQKEPPLGPGFAREFSDGVPGLQVSFELTLEDYLRFRLRSVRPRGFWRAIANPAKVFWLTSLGAILFWVSFAVNGVMPRLSLLSLVIGIMLCFSAGKAFWDGSTWRRRNLAYRIAEVTPGLLGAETVLICPEAFFSTSPYSEHQRAWRGLRGITEEEGYFFIYESSSHAFVIPKRSFDSFEATEAFFHAARGYLQQAKSGTLVDKPKEGSWPPAPTARN